MEPNYPILCANNCGFFGSASNHNLCSKCYRDFLLKNSQSSSSNAIAAIAEKKEENQEAIEKIAKRCNFCRKKVGLIGFKCRCGQIFCSNHRFPEKHDCSFDYRKAGKDEIARANPVVKKDKVDKI